MRKILGCLLGLSLFLLISGSASAEGPDPQSAPPVWQASYWTNKYMNGEPALLRTESAIDHDWGGGSPGPGIEKDAFSARWTRYVDVPAAHSVQFDMIADDGMRVLVDGQIIMEDWRDHPAVHHTAVKTLSAGRHLIVVEYYENSDAAVAKFWMTPDFPSATFEYWRGEYFNNIGLLGAPALVRDDPHLNFQWNDASPAPGIVNPDNFSVRWTRDLSLAAGSYRFTLTVDDGARLWVNNRLLIDTWQEQPAHTYTGDIDLAGGSVPVRLEYYEQTGAASISLSWGAPETPTTWHGEYYNNDSLAGTPALIREDASINFAWGDSSPAADVIAPDHFSVRWTRSADLPAGNYHFALATDDGARLWVNDQLLIDAWQDQALQTRTADVYLPGGSVPIKLEYYENSGGAFAILNWSVDPPLANWRGEYFNNATLSGLPVLQRDDAAINFDWGSASPAPGIVNTDNFSARWTRSLDLPAGTQHFTVTADDGVRLWVNGYLLIDAWKDQAATTYTGDISLPGGSVPIRLEYYENAYNAIVRLDWSAPASTLRQTVTVDNADLGFQRGGSTTGWHTAAGGVLNRMLWTHNNNAVRAGYNWARWYPALRAGRYEVFARIPDLYSTTAQARYWVSQAGGLSLRIVNQNTSGKSWVSLGTYQFRGTRADYVSLADVTYEPYQSRLVAWDAVKWEPR